MPKYQANDEMTAVVELLSDAEIQAEIIYPRDGDVPWIKIRTARGHGIIDSALFLMPDIFSERPDGTACLYAVRDLEKIGFTLRKTYDNQKEKVQYLQDRSLVRRGRHIHMLAPFSYVTISPWP